MATKGECELCGFADDSYRIEENGAVMKVCKFCHDGYLERMGLSPDADQPVENVALSLDLDIIREAGIDTEGMSGAELLELEMELAERKNTRVPTLDEAQLDTLLATTDDDKRVLTSVRQKELRRKKRAAQAGEDDTGEDYKASEELLRSGEELQRVVEGLQKISEGLPDEEGTDEEVAPLIAKIVAPPKENDGREENDSEPPQIVRNERVADEHPREETQVAPQKEEYGKKEERNTTERENGQSVGTQTVPEENDMKEKNTKLPVKEKDRAQKEERTRALIHEAANQTIDDERIQITSPEVALSKDTRPKTNLDVAISEYAGGVRFLDSFKYVLHKIGYAVFLGIIVLAVSTVLFIRDGWQHALIVFGGGVGAVAVGFLLMWYLMHCYELDRRALLLRIRQQEILFAGMNSECYRELRTKFTIIKALGWLLNKLTVLLPLVVFVGGNVAAVIVTFLQMYWLLPVVSALSSVAGILLYYIVKFGADCIAYKLDIERNQQIQQQTLLDLLAQLKK